MAAAAIPAIAAAAGPVLGKIVDAIATHSGGPSDKSPGGAAHGTWSRTGDVHSLESTENVAVHMSAPSATNLVPTAALQPGVQRTQQDMTVSDVMPTSSMSVTDMVSQPNTIATFVIQPTATAGTVIFSHYNSPSTNSLNTSRLNYLSNLFLYWRGTIDYQFVWTKTILIQTKIMLVFVPGALPTTPAPTLAQVTQYRHRVIINPANEEVTTFSVPFVSTRPFLEMNEGTGMVYAIIWQPLVISVGDANTLPVTVLQSARGIDMREFAPVPNIDSTSFPIPPTEYSYAYVSAGLGDAGSFSAGTVMQYITDAGSVVTGTQAIRSGAYLVRGFVPIFGAGYINFTSSDPYNANTCRTLFGSPRPAEPSVTFRYVLVPTTITSGTTANFMQFGVITGQSGAVWARLLGGVGAFNVFDERLAGGASVATPIFEWSWLPSTTNFNARLLRMLETYEAGADSIDNEVPIESYFQ